MNYRPLSCSLDDMLEDAIVRKRVVTLGLASADLTIETRIRDLITSAEAEYLVVENGAKYRLDHIVSIDGRNVEFQNRCRF